MLKSKLKFEVFMEKRVVLAGICVGIAAAILLPGDVFAATVDATKTFDVEGIGDHTTKVKNFLQGYPIKMVGILGGAYGTAQSILSASIQPLIAYGGIGLTVNIVPKFIDAVFVSGMLTP